MLYGAEPRNTMSHTHTQARNPMPNIERASKPQCGSIATNNDSETRIKTQHMALTADTKTNWLPAQRQHVNAPKRQGPYHRKTWPFAAAGKATAKFRFGKPASSRMEPTSPEIEMMPRSPFSFGTVLFAVLPPICIALSFPCSLPPQHPRNLMSNITLNKMRIWAKFGNTTHSNIVQTTAKTQQHGINDNGVAMGRKHTRSSNARRVATLQSSRRQMLPNVVTHLRPEYRHNAMKRCRRRVLRYRLRCV